MLCPGLGSPAALGRCRLTTNVTCPTVVEWYPQKHKRGLKEIGVPRYGQVGLGSFSGERTLIYFASLRVFYFINLSCTCPVTGWCSTDLPRRAKESSNSNLAGSEGPVKWSTHVAFEGDLTAAESSRRMLRSSRRDSFWEKNNWSRKIILDAIWSLSIAQGLDGRFLKIQARCNSV